MLFSSHREHPVEREPILLWPSADLGRFHLYRLEVVTEGDHNFAAFPSFDGIYGTESMLLEIKLGKHALHRTSSPTNYFYIGRARHSDGTRERIFNNASDG